MRTTVETVTRFPIQAFVGPNGGGKTYGAVHKAVLPSWAKGRPCYSNLRLYPERAGYHKDLYVPLTSWRQLANLKPIRKGGTGGVVLLDEISSVLPSRQAQTVPPDLLRRVNQLRKVDVVLVWTAPAWARCDLALREVTRSVTVCKGRLPDAYRRIPGTANWLTPSGDVLVEDGHKVRDSTGWGANRWFVWTTYDAESYEGEFTEGAAAKAKPKGIQHHWRPFHDTGELYGTLDEVGLLDHLDDVGVCVQCGGHRRRKSCSCETVAS